VGLRAVEQLFRIGRLVILARILAPDDFGTMGVALLTMGALQTFSESGFHAALVQKKENIREYLDSAWTVSVLRGGVLAGLLWLVAPFAVEFFDAPAALPIVRVIAAALLVQGCTNVAVVLFQRELEFHRQFVYQALGTFVDFAVAVGCAWWLGSVWALVWGLLAGETTRMIASYLVHDYRPRFRLDRQKLAELWRYGRWILGSTVLTFLLTQGDDIVVGRLIGASALGLYLMAYRISNLPATEFSKLVATVTFPAFAKIQGNVPLLAQGYLKVLQLTALCAAPIAAGVFVFARDFTEIVLTEPWRPMIPALQVLAFLGLLRAIASPGPMFLALGKPQWRTWLQLVGLVVLGIAIVPLTLRWGIVGAAVAATLRVAVTKGLAIGLAARATSIPLRRIGQLLLGPLLAATVAGFAVIELHDVFPVDGAATMLLLAGLGGAIYLVVAALLDVLLRSGHRELLREQFRALTGKL